MDRRNFPALRSLPRVFIPDIPVDFSPIQLPQEEYQKFHKVLRLGNGDQVAILPGDGRILRCELNGHVAIPLEQEFPDTEPSVCLTLIQALPKIDKLEMIVRHGAELGVLKFVFFTSDRTIVRWDSKKFEEKIHRLKVIARESAEVSFRTHLPGFDQVANLKEALQKFPSAVVLSESEKAHRVFNVKDKNVEIIVGPEGGWSPRELHWIGERGVTLGPRVFRVETAAIAASALVLLGTP